MTQHRLDNAEPRLHRRGMITHEALIAMLLATVVIVGAAEVAVAVSKQKGEIDRRSLARREAGNLMEEAMLVPWQDLDVDGSRVLELSDTARNRLPSPQARLVVSSFEDDEDVRRIMIEVTWGAAKKRLAPPVRLVAWRHRRKEPQP